MRSQDISEFCVLDNLPFLIQHVRLLIWHLGTPIRGLLNPINQVIPPVSHICMYLPHCFHIQPPISLSRPQLYHHRRTQRLLSLSISLCDDQELSLSAAYTEYRIHPRLFIFFVFSRLQVNPGM